MPREVIRAERQSGEVHVGWTKDRDGTGTGYVQVGTSSVTDSSVQFTDLDNQSINRLIRTLRRARDEAFNA